MKTILYWEGRRIEDVGAFCRENGFDLVWVQDYRHIPARVIPANDEAIWAEKLERLLMQKVDPDGETIVLGIEELRTLWDLLSYLQDRAEYMETGESEEPVGPPYALPAPFVEEIPRVDEQGVYMRILYREKTREG